MAKSFSGMGRCFLTMKILSSLQSKFLKLFFQSYLGQDFFLTGGTALSAFYFQHRISEDLDLFTLKQNVEFNAVSAEVLKIIKLFSAKIENQVSSPTFLRFIMRIRQEKLKVDIVKDTLPHFGKLKKVEDLQIDSLENLAVGKLLALFGRADAKDFVDLYFLLKIKKTITFEKLFNMAKKKDAGLNEFYLADMFSKVNEIKFFPEMFTVLDKEDFADFFIGISNRLYRQIKPKI